MVAKPTIATRAARWSIDRWPLAFLWLLLAACVAGQMIAARAIEVAPPLYRIIYAGCWSSADTNFPGPFPSLGLVFATNVASCFVSNSNDLVNWNCWTELSNVTAGQTNFVSYCCAPRGPSQLFFKVAFPQ